MKKKIFIILYYSLFQHLPSSFFPLGRFFNKARIFCLKKIIPIGENNKVQHSIYIGGGNNLTIGDNCQINERVKLDNVIISNHVMIAPGVTILGKMHEFSNSKIPMVLQGDKKVRPTFIEDDVWIGTNAIIMPGIEISKGCIIGAGSVLTKSTEEYGVYGGVPAKLIKKRK